MKVNVNEYKNNLRKKIYIDNNNISFNPNITRVIENFACVNKASDWKENSVVSLTKNDIFDLTYDFYKSFLDKNLFNIFECYFKNRNENILFLKKSKYNLEGYTDENNIIKIINNNKYNYIILDTLIHEIGHAIANIYNDKNCNLDYKLAYSEIESIFPEFLSIMFINEKEYSQTIYNSYLSLCNLNNILNYKLEVYYYMKNNNIDINNKDLFFKLNNDLGCDYECLAQTYETPFNYYLPYTIGSAYAFFLINIYMDDKDYALKLYKDILNMHFYNERYYEKYLSNNGIYPNYSCKLFRGIKK